MIAIYWVNHHHLSHPAQRVDARILWANINLLFWMSLLTWVTAYLGESHAAPLAVGGQHAATELTDLVAPDRFKVYRIPP